MPRSPGSSKSGRTIRANARSAAPTARSHADSARAPSGRSTRGCRASAHSPSWLRPRAGVMRCVQTSKRCWAGTVSAARSPHGSRARRLELVAAHAVDQAPGRRPDLARPGDPGSSPGVVEELGGQPDGLIGTTRMYFEPGDVRDHVDATRSRVPGLDVRESHPESGAEAARGASRWRIYRWLGRRPHRVMRPARYRTGSRRSPRWG